MELFCFVCFFQTIIVHFLTKCKISLKREHLNFSFCLWVNIASKQGEMWHDLVHWGQSRFFSKLRYLPSRIGAYFKKYWSKPQLHSLFLDQVTNFWPVIILFFFLYFFTSILTCISTLEMLTLASMDHIMSQIGYKESISLFHFLWTIQDLVCDLIKSNKHDQPWLVFTVK